MSAEARCPCGRDAPFVRCCGVYLSGAREAPDAESMMRSRYTAFARRDVEYIYRTLHADHPDRAVEARSMRAQLRHSVEAYRYMGLSVLDVAPPDQAGVARVLFHARVFHKGRDSSIVEASDFVHDGLGWRYKGCVAASAAVLRGALVGLTLPRFLELQAPE